MRNIWIIGLLGIILLCIIALLVATKVNIPFLSRPINDIGNALRINSLLQPQFLEASGAVNGARLVGNNQLMVSLLMQTGVIDANRVMQTVDGPISMVRVVWQPDVSNSTSEVRNDTGIVLISNPKIENGIFSITMAPGPQFWSLAQSVSPLAGIRDEESLRNYTINHEVLLHLMTYLKTKTRLNNEARVEKTNELLQGLRSAQEKTYSWPLVLLQ